MRSSNHNKSFRATSDSAFKEHMRGSKVSQPSPNQLSKSKTKLQQMTLNLVSLYQKCNPDFQVFDHLPQRILTNPAEAVLNNGRDNEEANLICRVHDKLLHGDKAFVILDLLGTGTFGQVFRCQCEETKEIFAVKVIKNKPAYHAQGLVEIKIAKLLNNTFDPDDQRHMVRLIDSFEHLGHICLVFELLSISLLDVLTQNQFRGLPLSVVQRFTRQMLTALVTLQDANVVHCDLKPENILLVPALVKPPSKATNTAPENDTGIGDSKDESDKRVEPAVAAKESALSKALALATSSKSDDQQNQTSTSNASSSSNAPQQKRFAIQSDIKVIDFGSACFEGRTVYSYIQSRFYRSPEVLLGVQYNGAIDMWSLACVCVEMYLGLPLFPGVSQHNQLARIVDMFGMPPDFLIEGKNGRTFFTENTGIDAAANSISTTQTATTYTDATSRSDSMEGTPNTGSTVKRARFRLKTAEEYARATNTEVPVLRKYLRYKTLEEVILKCPLSSKIKQNPERLEFEMLQRRSFLDFLQGLFLLNPLERWTARQAATHPFVTNAGFTGPHRPPDDVKLKERRLAFMVRPNQISQSKLSQYRPASSGALSMAHYPDGSKMTLPILQKDTVLVGVHSGVISASTVDNNLSAGTETTQAAASATQVGQTSSADAQRPMLKRGDPVHSQSTTVSVIKEDTGNTHASSSQTVPKIASSVDDTNLPLQSTTNSNNNDINVQAANPRRFKTRSNSNVEDRSNSMQSRSWSKENNFAAYQQNRPTHHNKSGSGSLNPSKHSNNNNNNVNYVQQMNTDQQQSRSFGVGTMPNMNPLVMPAMNSNMLASPYNAGMMQQPIPQQTNPPPTGMVLLPQQMGVGHYAQFQYGSHLPTQFISPSQSLNGSYIMNQQGQPQFVAYSNSAVSMPVMMSSSMGSSLNTGVFNISASMHDNSDRFKSELGYAMRRPEMDEQRLLMSQNPHYFASPGSSLPMQMQQQQLVYMNPTGGLSMHHQSSGGNARSFDGSAGNVYMQSSSIPYPSVGHMNQHQPQQQQRGPNQYHYQQQKQQQQSGYKSHIKGGSYDGRDQHQHRNGAGSYSNQRHQNQQRRYSGSAESSSYINSPHAHRRNSSGGNDVKQRRDNNISNNSDSTTRGTANAAITSTQERTSEASMNSGDGRNESLDDDGVGKQITSNTSSADKNDASDARPKRTNSTSRANGRADEEADWDPFFTSDDL